MITEDFNAPLPDEIIESFCGWFEADAQNSANVRAIAEPLIRIRWQVGSGWTLDIDRIPSVI
ncbi:MAG: hypothetical protein V2J20_00970 [Wenzhouxiangella sp.]|nr:hypothetical protein [Wenzhouxiangella sp.]